MNLQISHSAPVSAKAAPYRRSSSTISGVGPKTFRGIQLGHRPRIHRRDCYSRRGFRNCAVDSRPVFM